MSYLYVAVVPRTWPEDRYQEFLATTTEMAGGLGVDWLTVQDNVQTVEFWWLPKLDSLECSARAISRLDSRLDDLRNKLKEIRIEMEGVQSLLDENAGEKSS